MKIGYLGPIGSYSYEAAQKYKKEEDELKESKTIEKVISSLENDAIDICIVPLENAIHGAVVDTMDTILENKDINIIDEIVLDVHHMLMSKTKDSTIAKIYSHSQALEQCRTYLNEKFADVEKIPVSSTSYAASLAQKESDTACICNEICKDLYGLEIVSDNIQDIKDNKTRFIVLSKAKNSRKTKKTSIVFSTKDEPGALYKILGMFSIAEINLTKIESRPAKTKLGDYIFFVDLEGDEKNEKIKLTLANIANYCDEFRILGSY